MPDVGGNLRPNSSNSFPRPVVSRSSIRPLGSGPNFSYTRHIRPEELSPQSPSSASAALSDAGSSSDVSEQREPVRPQRPRAGRVVTQATFIVEEMEHDDSEDGNLEVIRPHAIEYADSDRSRSRSRNAPEADRGGMYKLRDDLRNLAVNCSDESDQSDIDEAEYMELIVKRRAEKRQKRMSSGSIGKRTISESIGSDSDREDVQLLDAHEVGSSARRLRRRVGDRRSLQFQDPPPPRIEELEEPPTSDDELLVGESLARELPYYTLEYISMEVDSP